MSINWKQLCWEALEAHPFPGLPDGVRLPALPGAVNAFIERSADPEASTRELAEIVESDSGLTCELLKYVNSAAWAGPHKIANATQAIATLGLRQAKVFVISAGTKAAMLSSATRVINLNSFWNEVLQRALFSRTVAQASHLTPELAFGGALLQDFLLPVLTYLFADEYYEFIRAARAQPLSLCEYERRVFGWDHAIAGAHVARYWNLPEELICCVFYHHRLGEVAGHPQLADSACLPVALSSLLSGQIPQEADGERRLIELVKTTNVFDLVEIGETVDQQHAELANGCLIEFPLRRRFEKQLAQEDGSR